MPLRSVILLLLLLPMTAEFAEAQNRRGYPPVMKGAREEVYKRVGDVELKLYLFEPQVAAERPRPAVVFFFGGGWRSGTPQQFEQHCRHLASKGVVGITADYRVSSRHETKAKHCVEDGKSAIRWLRQNARRLNIDPQRIAAGGGSAGGHVAACTGVLPHGDAADEDGSVSSRPDLMILFNPAVVLAPVDGEQVLRPLALAALPARMGVEPKQLSPYHHVVPKLPPTLIFHGKADKTVPYASVELFAEAMTKAGNPCLLSGFEGAGHGFFNYGRDDNAAYQQTIREMDAFLAEHDFLPEGLVVLIAADGKFSVGGKVVDERGLESLIKRAPANTSVVIRADAEARYDRVVLVIDLCNKAGVKDISVAAK